MEGRLGELSIISFLLHSEKAFDEVQGQLEVETFGTGPAKAIFATLEGVHRRFGRFPTATETELLLTRAAGPQRWSTAFTAEVIKGARWCYEEQPTEVSGEFLQNFLRLRDFRSIQRDLEDLDYSKIPEKLDRLKHRLSSMEDYDFAGELGIFPYAEETLKNPAQLLKSAYGGVPMPMGIPAIDQRMQGGTWPGEMTMFVAPTGVGKTMLMCAIANYLCKHGYRGIYYYLDNLEGEMLDRLWANSSGVRIDQDKEESTFGGLIRMGMGGYSQNLLIKEMVPGKTTVRDLRRHMRMARRFWKELDRQNGVPEEEQGLIHYGMVDYGDLVAAESGSHHKEERHRIKNVFEMMLAWAKSPGEAFRLYTATQGNAASLQVETIGLTNLAEAYAKSWVASHIISMSQTPGERALCQARASVLKSRRTSTLYQVALLLDYGLMRVAQNPDAPVQQIVSLGEKVKKSYEPKKPKEPLKDPASGDVTKHELAEFTSVGGGQPTQNTG